MALAPVWVWRSQEAKMTSSQIQSLAQHKPYKDVELESHISLRHDYTYYQISKAASSTVKVHLQTLEYQQSPFRLQDVNNKYLSPHLSPFQLPEGQFARMMQSGDALNITFVRNPYARRLSCYLHRIQAQPDSPSSQHFARLNNGITGKDVPFSDFIERICDQAPADMDSHWRVQYDCVMYPFVTWGFTGKVETLTQDMTKLFDLLRIRRAISYNPASLSKPVNSSPMQTSANQKLRSYITPLTQFDRREI